MDALNTPAKVDVRSFTRSWDNRGYSKKGGQSLDTPTLPFLPNFYGTFVRMDPVNTCAKFEVRSFTSPWDNRRYSKHLGSPWIRPRSLFSQIFHRLLFGWTLWTYLPNLKFVALPAAEIIGGTEKIRTVPGYAHAPFSPKFFMGLCSDLSFECIRQICTP